MLMNIPLLLPKKSVLKERLSPIIFVLFNFRILSEPNPPSAVNCFTESVGWPEAAAGDELRVNDVKS